LVLRKVIPNPRNSFCSDPKTPFQNAIIRSKIPQHFIYLEAKNMEIQLTNDHNNNRLRSKHKIKKFQQNTTKNRAKHQEISGFPTPKISYRMRV